MSRRITAADVAVTRREMVNGKPVVQANVAGRHTVFVVDLNPAWSDRWLCSCGSPATCPHVRAVREVTGL